MSGIRVLQIDAFADRRFGGNSAVVCFLEEDLGDEWMQAVAGEMNVSGTAFVRSRNDGFGLRFFTPAVEVDLSGHTTLASAHAVWSEGLVTADDPIRFHTKSGELICTRQGEFIELDFPATPARQIEPPAGLTDSLGIDALFVGQTRFDLVVEVASEKVVRDVRPDFSRLAQIPTRGIMVTSLSDDPRFDFVSRFFAPRSGILEDPVTGSAHCCLGPLWSQRLDKKQLNAYQASGRGGMVRVHVKGDRVALGGQAVTILRGELVGS